MVLKAKKPLGFRLGFMAKKPRVFLVKAPGFSSWFYGQKASGLLGQSPWVFVLVLWPKSLGSSWSKPLGFRLGFMAKKPRVFLVKAPGFSSLFLWPKSPRSSWPKAPYLGLGSYGPKGPGFSSLFLWSKKNRAFHKAQASQNLLLLILLKNSNLIHEILFVKFEFKSVKSSVLPLISAGTYLQLSGKLMPKLALTAPLSSGMQSLLTEPV